MADVDISRVDLNLFVVFDVIYREGNLTRASEALNLSQPAVSHALGRLRDRFDDPLFERSGKQMVPTPLAKAIVERVRSALGNLESTLTEGLAFDPQTAERTFTIAMRDVLEASSLPIIATKMQSLAPGITIRSVRLPRKELESALVRGEIDFATDILWPVSERINHTLLRKEPLAVLVRDGHPLSQNMTLEDYLNARHIQVSGRPEGMGVEDIALARSGEARQIAMRCQNFYAAAKVAEATDWLLTLPYGYAEALCGTFGTRLMPVPFSSEPLEIYLYWHRKNEQDPALMWCQEQILRLIYENADE